MSKKALRSSLALLLALGLYPTLAHRRPHGVRLALASAPAQARPRAVAEPVLEDPDPNFATYPEAIPGRYLVVFAPDAVLPPRGGVPDLGPLSPERVAQGLCATVGATLVSTFAHVGSFLVEADEATARRLSHDPQVAFVESDAVVHACGTDDAVPGYALLRINRNPPVFGSQHYTTNYTGNGVDVWVLDSGVWPGGTNDTDLKVGGVATGASRVVADFPTATNLSTTLKRANNTYYNSSDDDTGHGTFVASIVGGYEVGVAREVRFRAVKVLNYQDEGSVASVVEGLDYVEGKLPVAGRRSVVNLSLMFALSRTSYSDKITSSQEQALRAAIERVTAKNAVVVAAAGNSRRDASDFSPACLGATVPGVICAGGTTYDFLTGKDRLWADGTTSGSNFGACVDVFAPADNVEGVTFTNSGTSRTQVVVAKSGTSIPTAMASGVAALSLEGYPGNNPYFVKQAVLFQTYGSSALQPSHDTATTSDSLVDFLTNAAGRPGVTGTPDRMLCTGIY